MIDVQDLHISFGDNHVVRGVSFEVQKGECFGLVGESGCGKSTVLGAVAGRVRDWKGRLRIDGTPIASGRRTRDQLRRQQMVFQDPFGSLHPRHTIGRTLEEPLAIHGIGDRQKRVADVLEAVGLPHGFRHRFPHQLSGGQRQRVAIARALILRPSILLLDEPTSALDVSVQAEVLNLLKDLREAENLTYILVSHDMAVVAHLCDRIAVMQDGVLVETATRAQMVSGDVSHPYTRLLRNGSKGYQPQGQLNHQDAS